MSYTFPFVDCCRYVNSRSLFDFVPLTLPTLAGLHHTRYLTFYPPATRYHPAYYHAPYPRGTRFTHIFPTYTHYAEYALIHRYARSFIFTTVDLPPHRILPHILPAHTHRAVTLDCCLRGCYLHLYTPLDTLRTTGYPPLVITQFTYRTGYGCRTPHLLIIGRICHRARGYARATAHVLAHTPLRSAARLPGHDFTVLDFFACPGCLHRVYCYAFSSPTHLRFTHLRTGRVGLPTGYVYGHLWICTAVLRTCTLLFLSLLFGHLVLPTSVRW